MFSPKLPKSSTTSGGAEEGRVQNEEGKSLKICNEARERMLNNVITDSDLLNGLWLWFSALSARRSGYLGKIACILFGRAHRICQARRNQ